MAILASAPANGKLKRTRASVHIDMTPMVDLAFLLLTFFIMTTTLMKHSVLEIRQPASDPEDRHTDVNQEKVLNLVLADDDRIYWYMGLPGGAASMTDYSGSGIRRLLSTKKAMVKELYVFIKASDQSRYQNMIDILDEVAIADINNYYMLTLEAEDKKLIEQAIP